MFRMNRKTPNWVFCIRLLLCILLRRDDDGKEEKKSKKKYFFFKRKSIFPQLENKFIVHWRNMTDDFCSFFLFFNQIKSKRLLPSVFFCSCSLTLWKIHLNIQLCKEENGFFSIDLIWAKQKRHDYIEIID